MPGRRDNGLEDLEFLTRSVETVFRKLIRFLVGRISLVRLLEMIRYIYVQEAERKLKTEYPGKNIPLTRFALITGLDTRTITQIRGRLEENNDQYQQQFLSELTPESAIIEAWVGQGGEPLSVGGENSDFERLVRETISARGITTASILQRLEATQSVGMDENSAMIELRVERYSPYLSDDEPNIVNAAFSAISNLLGTIEFNVDAGQEEKMFQRQKWTFRLSQSDQLEFRKAMREMLESMDQRAESCIEPWEAGHYGDGLITAGVGYYYFEENTVERP